MSEKILIVDDEETLCDVLRFNLEAEGYEVVAAYSAEEALAMNLAEFDLVLLDIMLGEISGMQLARILRANPSTAGVPVIFCTARDTEDDKVEGLDIGARRLYYQTVFAARGAGTHKGCASTRRTHVRDGRVRPAWLRRPLRDTLAQTMYCRRRGSEASAQGV